MDRGGPETAGDPPQLTFAQRDAPRLAAVPVQRPIVGAAALPLQLISARLNGYPNGTYGEGFRRQRGQVSMTDRRSSSMELSITGPAALGP